MGNTINIILGVVIVLGALLYFDIIEINDEDEIRNSVNDNINIPEPLKVEEFDCTSRSECAEILGLIDGNEMDAVGKFATAQICGLYLSDLTSQLNPEDGNDIAIMFQGGSTLIDILENYVILMDGNAEVVVIERTSSMSNMNAQYCVEGRIEFLCTINCVSGDFDRGLWDLVISPTSLEHIGKCQTYIDKHGLNFPSPVFYQLTQRHCLV